jgi:hypothetical protein
LDFGTPLNIFYKYFCKFCVKLVSKGREWAMAICSYRKSSSLKQILKHWWNKILSSYSQVSFYCMLRLDC